MTNTQKAEELTDVLESALGEADDWLTNATNTAKLLIDCFDAGDPDRARAERWYQQLVFNSTVSKLLEEISNLDGSAVDPDADDNDTEAVVAMLPAKFKALVKAAEFARDHRDAYSVSD